MRFFYKNTILFTGLEKRHCGLEDARNMAEIVFESHDGYVYEKTTYKNGRCKVAVKYKPSGYVDMTYRYKDVPGLDSPYISWENLSYCAGGWDSEYMLTAVQRGKKLYAGPTFSFNEGDVDRERSVYDTVAKIKDGLPEDCVMGCEEPQEHRNGPHISRHFFICKTGSICDYISLDDVFNAYGRLGIMIDTNNEVHIRELCEVPLEDYSGRSAPFQYVNAVSGYSLVVTGLLLGYPLESTAWLLERGGHFPVKK